MCLCVCVCVCVCVRACVCVYVWCAGVWDVMSNIEVAEFVRKKIASNMKPQLVSCITINLQLCGLK